MADEKEILTTTPERAKDADSDWLFTGAEIRALHRTSGAFGSGAGVATEPEADRLDALFESEMPIELPELEVGSVPIQTELAEESADIRRGATGLLAPMRAQDSEDAEGLAREKHIVFSLAGARYAVSMANILEIAELSYLTPVPNVPGWVVGVTNLRGDILSVIDLRAFIGVSQEEVSDSQRMIVSQTANGEVTTGLLVDRVMGMEGVEADQVLGLKAGSDNRLAPYLKGVYGRDEQGLCVIDLEALLRSLEDIK
jgi:purine-binding chemotaxis protein CheW